MNPKEFEELLQSKEDEHLEFKEAKSNYHFEDLVKYCVALANERGGKIILGVTDKKPRKVVGTAAFEKLEQTKFSLTQRIPLRIETEQFFHPNGRVLIFNVPSRPIGVPIQYHGAYYMRAGESLIAMTQDMLKNIFNEAGPDYSADICPKANIADLNPIALEDFRARWIQKSKNNKIKTLAIEQLLVDSELLTKEGLTYAALILFGSHEALGKHLAQSEVIFEYRSDESSSSPQFRKEYRQGFFSYYDDLWETINLRNDRQHFQDGLFIWDIPTFNESAVRELILNAISHRDYRLPGSVFIRQYPRFLEIVSPGGLPAGITLDNILWAQSPRNRRLAESFSRCGLVERSGQGMNRIFESCIRESKPHPDFSNTDDYHVGIALIGLVQDQRFLRFLEELGKEMLASFSTQEFLLIDQIFHGQSPRGELQKYLNNLIELGIIERINKGRGTRYILAYKFYKYLGEKGTYTRRKGLDRETNKSLLLAHIHKNQREGSRMQEFRQILPHYSSSQIQVLLRELVKSQQIHVHGVTNASRWYPGPKANSCEHY